MKSLIGQKQPEPVPIQPKNELLEFGKRLHVLISPASLKSYSCTFLSGYTAGIFGELTSLSIKGKCNALNITNPSFRDNCVFSGVQQVAKEVSKNTLKQIPTMVTTLKENPFLFGAATGLPMWAITRVFANPVQNARKGENQPFKGFVKSVVDDTAYYTVKNGLDEFCSAKIFPEFVPKIQGFWQKRAFEGLVSAIVGAGCYTLTWPIKSVIAGQRFPEALTQTAYAFPKVFVKKISYTVSRPYFVKLIQ